MVEGTSRAIDLTHAQEIIEGALDLEGGGVERTGVEGGNVDGIASLGDDLEEALRQELAMQGVRAVIDEILGLEAV